MGAAAGASLGVEVELNDKEAEHGDHHDDTGDGRVDSRKEVGQAWVRETEESGREELEGKKSISIG